MIFAAVDADCATKRPYAHESRHFLGRFGASTDAAGRFRIADLPAEPMRLRAGPPAPGAAPVNEVRRPPFEPVRLVVSR